MKYIAIFFFLAIIFFTFSNRVIAQSIHTTGVIHEFQEQVTEGFTEEIATVELANKKIVQAKYGGVQSGDTLSSLFQVGQKVVITIIENENEEPLYVITDPYRIPALTWVVVGFFVLVFAVGRIRGLTSLIGLILSIAVVVFFIVPKIANGSSPLFIGLLGSIIIALLSITTAHGFSRRTMVALASTLLTLLIAVFISSFVVRFTRLFGLGTEDASILQFGQYSDINFQGLLLAGIVIGALGVLDDVTTAQVAAVDEIHKANPHLTKKELAQHATSVGKEHLTSMVNTLALAYAGASLPLLLYFSTSSLPAWAIINGEMVAEEIIRTLIGSASLILAVPISTFLAIRLLVAAKPKKPVDK